MGKRISIGIYISPIDADIAAWFNLLKRSGQSYTRWIKALLAAYALNDSVRIGVIDRKAPLIRGKNGEPGRNTVEKKGGFHYGWQIRGPDGEYVIGSTINVCVPKQDLQPILEEAWSNGHKLSTFVKSLIRKNLKAADKDIPPKMEEYTRVWSAYLVYINSKNTDPDREIAEPFSSPAQAAPWVTNDIEGPVKKTAFEGKGLQEEEDGKQPKQEGSAPASPAPAKQADPSRVFSFADDIPDEPDKRFPEPEPSGNTAIGINPLVGLI